MHAVVTGAAGFVGRALVARLLADRRVDRLTLMDIAFADHLADARVHLVAGSVADAHPVSSAFAEPVDVVFHLASVPGGTAEQQSVLARRVNVDGTLALLEACMAQVEQGGAPPHFVFASSIAVLGAPLPPRVDDATPPRPVMTYGAHKWMGEIAVADFSRRGACVGVSLRLPGVLARPPARTGQLSAFLSDLLREPVAGRDVRCPMAPKATTWAVSTPNAVDNLLHAWTIGADVLPIGRALTLPALHFSMAQLLNALATVHGERVRTHVRFEPEEPLEALFGCFPPLSTPGADRAGFRHDGTLATLVRRAVEPF